MKSALFAPFLWLFREVGEFSGRELAVFALEVAGNG